MVDVDHRAGMLDLGAALAEAPEGGAVEGEDDVAERRAADLDRLESGQVLEQARQRIGDDHANLPAHRAQRDGKAEGAPEAVGVGILVREAGDLIGAVDDGADRFHDVLEGRPGGGCGDGHSGTSTGASAGRSPSRSLRSVLTLTLYAIDSSSSKWSRGMLRRFSSRLPS